jgi:hypothetical protein
MLEVNYEMNEAENTTEFLKIPRDLKSFQNKDCHGSKQPISNDQVFPMPS